MSAEGSATFIAITLIIANCFPIMGAADDFVFVDSAGNIVPVSEDAPGVFAQPENPTHVLKAGNLTFNVTYQDVLSNTDAGFDDPSEGAARRATIVAVLAYINGVLNENTGASIDVRFNVSSNNPMGGSLAAAGTFFPIQDGFHSGVAHQHITSGADPSGSVVDIFCTVNFGHKWNSDHTQDPAGDEFDLFSNMLHEMTHGLGLITLSDANGRSRIQNANPGMYTVWDRLMRFNDLGTFEVIWKQSDPNITVLLQSTFVFVSNNLYISGANATAAFGSPPPVYAPNPFEQGSSLGHFKTGTVNSVMTHATTTGVKEREYTAVDIGALVDIGYPNASGADPNNLFVDFTLSTNGVGTATSPFDNLADAVGIANAGATINLAAGTSTETFTGGNAIDKALTLQQIGGGSAIIGDVAKSGGLEGGFVSVPSNRRR